VKLVVRRSQRSRDSAVRALHAALVDGFMPQLDPEPGA
jgi:hypothetical protein